MAAPSLFIVEDEACLRNLYLDVLPTAGYRIAGFAADGDEAVSMVISMMVRPDLILMNHRTPGKAGLIAAAELLDMFSDLRILVVSAESGLRGEALRAGAIGLL